MKKLTKKEFIQKYEKKFGKKYSWEHFEYNGNKIKSIVTCPIHGDFEIRPNDLLNGTGCDYCGGTHKYTTDEYKKLVNKVHHGYYNLDDIEYHGGTKDVYPICPIHGEFRIRANRLLRGCCCSDCNKENIYHEITPILFPEKKWSKDTTETFKEKVKNKYGDKYILDKVDYIKNSINVLIGCKEHGYFPITPNHLLSGEGCPECAGNKKMTTESFITRSKLLYPGELEYNKTVYKSYHEPLVLTCPKHGDFMKSPANHFKGQMCPICSESKLEYLMYSALNENNIMFEREKKFDDFGRYRYDFYIPQKKILIECQGIQHFEKIDFFNKSQTITERIDADILKYKYAINNGYKIIYLIHESRNDLNDEKFNGIYNKNVFIFPNQIINFINNVNL